MSATHHDPVDRQRASVLSQSIAPAQQDLGRSRIVLQVGTSQRLVLAIVVVGIMLVLVSAFRFQAPELLGQRKVLTDFDAFHIAGRMAAEGKASDAYHMLTLLKAQREMSGTQSFMPWTYPPPFTAFMQALASLPIGMAFAAFALTSFAFYLWVLHRIAGPWMPATLMAIMPVIILNLRTGQNGFLVAGLIGSVLLAFRGRGGMAGLPLGLMIIKPHLAVGIGLTTLLQRRWSVIATAAAIVTVLLAASTWLYGISIWADFREAVTEAGKFLVLGYYPLFRMSSIYSTAYTLGSGANLAMALQGFGVIASLSLLVVAHLRGIKHRYLAALTCAASLFVSPYCYDYDLTLLGVALAFIMPDLYERCSGREIVWLVLLTWFVCIYGIAWNTVASAWKLDTGVNLDADNGGLALISPFLGLLCWLVVRACRPQGAHQ